MATQHRSNNSAFSQQAHDLARIALYRRVSTLNHQDPEMQLSELREYARRRDWRLNRTDPAGLNTAVTALSALFRSELPEVLEDYLQISRKRRNNRLALARLQTQLIDELVTVEAAIKRYRDKKAELEEVEKSDPGNVERDSREKTLIGPSSGHCARTEAHNRLRHRGQWRRYASGVGSLIMGAVLRS